MLLHFIHTSSLQSQPRMRLSSPVNAGCPPTGPPREQGHCGHPSAPLQVAMAKALGYRSGTAVRPGTAATAQSSGAAGHHEKREDNRSPTGHRPEWRGCSTAAMQGLPSLPIPVCPSAPAAHGEKLKQKSKAVGQKAISNVTEPSSVPLPRGLTHTGLSKGKVKFQFSAQAKSIP